MRVKEKDSGQETQHLQFKYEDFIWVRERAIAKRGGFYIGRYKF